MKPRYLNMVRRMAETAPARAPKEWSVYIVLCADGTYYTGIAKDLYKRIEQHNKGSGAVYTRDRRPVSLAYHEPRLSRSEALSREIRIKALSRAAKAGLCRHERTPA